MISRRDPSKSPFKHGNSQTAGKLNAARNLDERRNHVRLVARQRFHKQIEKGIVPRSPAFAGDEKRDAPIARSGCS